MGPVRRALALLLLATILIVPASWSAEVTLEEARRLDAQVVQLYRAGRYAEAGLLAERSLAIREKTLGPGHPDVATSLNNLAALYQAQGRHPEAEPLYKRSLAIWEKALGPDHPDIVTSLGNLAGLYEKLGKAKEAAEFKARAKAMQARLRGR